MTELVLLSGGIDSVTLLHLRHSEGAQLHALFIDYGQRAGREEWRAALVHSDALDVPLQRLDMAAVGDAFRAGQTRRLHVPLPHRNLVALALGLSYAAQIGAACLHLALNRDDADAYPSASPLFVQSFNVMSSHLQDIPVRTPLAELNKLQVIELALKLGINLNDTYSCLLGYAQPCGHCPQCLQRRTAFQALHYTQRPEFT